MSEDDVAEDDFPDTSTKREAKRKKKKIQDNEIRETIRKVALARTRHDAESGRFMGGSVYLKSAAKSTCVVITKAKGYKKKGTLSRKRKSKR